ncbi:transcriptional regulator, LacI family [Xylanimonas cellulosilytica DSM 15894]|uniref:Transcriptional regulator, LacI family n=1 Tax=Xylanimonas cellulosilytica (strain DSM 15894 / JCM 12276 / CECT 5975 / KCTC 9989 / LMG 20990 / NBRC 107835 / XIL07) TaxID=446471 RepID=D1BZ22_XYLCX|nr:LacI family DNA-binding transcriptional regulator [Xylanimonas cellulosilytica]ACZ31919.1 transcriptional regulator, LacI family [Xylanimonas cellulosilytica DSM 15894]
MEPRKPPVIADVARVAGVSVPTVSRVLNGTVPVSEERRARVMAAVKALDYRPNGAARSLANQAGSMIAVFAGNTMRYGYAATIQGVEEAARQAGLMVVVTVVAGDDDDVVETAVNHALGQPLVGAIVLDFDPPGGATLERLPHWLPAVAAASGGSSNEDRSRVYMDDRVAASHATRYLLDLGHSTVHHVAIPSAGGSARVHGWRDTLTDAGIEPPAVVHPGWDPLAARDVGLRLASDSRVTAILAGNDELAIGLIKGLVDGGRRIPDDVSVVGFDDHPLSQLWIPPLTTVRQDFVRLGRRAVELLVEQTTSGERAPSVRMIPDLVVRESTGPARTPAGRSPA